VPGLPGNQVMLLNEADMIDTLLWSVTCGSALSLRHEPQ